ncbi:MAG: pyrroline-5-carboxylate reductase [Nitrospirota bacterium]
MASIKRIAFIGGGNMAEAMIRGIIKAGLCNKKDIFVSDVSPDRLSLLKEKYGIETRSGNKEVLKLSDLIVLSVRPLVADSVLAEIKDQFDPGTLVISIVTGIPISRIAEGIDKKARVIRAVPNLPVLVGDGLTAISPGKGVTDEETKWISSLFNSVGRSIVLEEKYLDAVTGLAGSGPAFVFLILEAMADGGVKMGLPRETAMLLASQTLMGSARMVLETGEHPGTLKDRVASPGGTTIAGLHRLEKEGVRGTIISAIEAATIRAGELGRR